MSIPPNSQWRGCAAKFAQPLSQNDVLAAQSLVETVYYFNCRLIFPPVHGIIYRSSDDNHDLTHHVFCWDTTTYQQIFEYGFEARRQVGTPDNIYYNLNHYVHHGGRPLNSTRPATHAFVSTTLNSNWRPNINLQVGERFEAYRYEIYAPGGIWVAETLGDQYQYPAQDEVCFVAGIAPQYIRSTQLFIATREAGSRFITWTRANNILRVNRRVNPQSHPCEMINIQRPVFDYVNPQNNTRTNLVISIYRPQLEETYGRREKRQVSTDATNWYACRVADTTSYINAAFRSSRTNEAYLFMKNEYVLINYAPGTTKDKIIHGPLLICDGYPSLIGTSFGEYGIDCAFDTHNGNKAFIFSGNLCAYIDYAPGTTDDKILNGPMTITSMFPFFIRHKEFKNGIDSAFKATAKGEAYLFKGNQYALINYDSKRLIAIRNITDGFQKLRNTIFASGIEAAFASHRNDEAYIFKGDQYALINFAPGTTNDYIIGGIKQILPNWPSLQGKLPRNNRGLDNHDHHNHPQANRDRDEL